MGRDMWPKPFPHSYPYMPWQLAPGQTFIPPSYNGPTKEQFEEFLKLLRAAKKFDTLLGMKDCEMAEKLEWLKAIATHLGVDIKDLTP
jgi:hypothetical protein